MSVRRFGGGAALLLAALLAGCSSAGGVPGPAQVLPRPAPGAEAGIEVTALHVSGAGRLVDLRFRVIDAGKAAALLDRSTEAYALDQASGVRLPVPRAGKIGALRQTSAAADPGRIYFVLFANTGRVVQPGSRLTVVFGDLRLTDLLVE